jgi:hypothetical protein
MKEADHQETHTKTEETPSSDKNNKDNKEQTTELLRLETGMTTGSRT